MSFNLKVNIHAAAFRGPRKIFIAAANLHFILVFDTCARGATGLECRKFEPVFEAGPLNWNTRPPRPLKVIYLLVVNQNLMLCTSLGQ